MNFDKMIKAKRESNKEILESLKKIEQAQTLLGEAGITRNEYPEVYQAIAEAMEDIEAEEKKRLLKESGS